MFQCLGVKIITPMERIGPYLSALPELFGITLLTILIFLSFRNAACNWNVPVFENEDDIYDALSEGEIDYEEFSSLMQMMHEKIDLNGKELSGWKRFPESHDSILKAFTGIKKSTV